MKGAGLTIAFALIVSAVQAQCHESPATMPPERLWGPLTPATPSVRGDYDRTGFKGLPTLESGFWWEGIYDGPVIVAGTFFATATPRPDGTLPDQRNLRPLRSVYRDFCVNESLGEADIFLGNVAIDYRLSVICVAGLGSNLGLTCWSWPSLDPLYRDGMGGREVAAAGGYAFYAVGRGAKPGGAYIYDIGQILDCDTRCGTPESCPGTSIGRLDTQSRIVGTVSALEHDGMIYAAAADNPHVALFVEASGAFRRQALLMNENALSVRLFEVDGDAFLATRSTAALKIWSLESCATPCTPHIVWRSDSRFGNPSMSISGGFLYAYDKSSTCSPGEDESPDELILLDGRPTAWKRLDTGLYLGHLSTANHANGRGMSVRQFNGRKLFALANHSTVTEHWIDLAEPVDPAFIFADGFESGDIQGWLP